MTWLRLIIVLVLLTSACSGGGDAEAGDDGDSDVTATATETSAETSAETADNCSLITSDEATALAGYDLEVGEDSILGCGFIPPGSDVADIVVASAQLDGDMASLAAEGYPDATEIFPVSVGTDTVAVTTPSGDSVAAIITGDGGRVVELSIVFLLIEPEDSARIEAAAELAVTALGRWNP